MIEEAIVDAYGESEQTGGFYTMLEDNLATPFTTEMLGVDWEGILPHWFRVLAATAAPEEYAQRITALIGRHYHYGRDKMLAVARRIATPMQRAALAGAASPRPLAVRHGTRR